MFKAARWLGCPPWELEAQPLYYQSAALLFEAAEHNGKVEREKRLRPHGR